MDALRVVDVGAQVIGFVLVAAGTMLKHDGSPRHVRLGTVEERLGGAGLVLGMLLRDRAVSDARAHCKVWRSDYSRCAAEATDWTFALGLDDVLKAAVLAAVAYGLGRVLARLTPARG